MRKNVKPRTMFEQILCEDYWEGHYALRNGSVVKCFDCDDGMAGYAVFDLRTGKKVCEGTFAFKEEQTFNELAKVIAGTSGSSIYLRISNESENPDRHEEIDSILENPDPFELIRIKNLVSHLKSRSINIFGGKLGGMSLGEGPVEGFYLLESGRILLCRNISVWESDKMDRIVDGVIGYRVLDPASFDIPSSKEHYFGYLDDEKFSDLAESLVDKEGIVKTQIARTDSELFSVLTSAGEGDAGSAALASHRLRMNICIKRPQ